MGIQIQLQQFEKNFGIQQGYREPKGTVESLTSLRSTLTRRRGRPSSSSSVPFRFQVKSQVQFLGGQGARAQPGTQLLE